MKQTSVRRLFHKIKGLHENITPTPEYKEHSDKFYEYEKQLIPELYANLDLYRNLMEEKTAIQTESENMYWEDGFKFGLLLGIDASKENNI